MLTSCIAVWPNIREDGTYGVDRVENLTRTNKTKN